MAIYSISYDLIKDKDYTKVIAAIKAISGSWAKPTESQWLVDTEQTQKQVREYVQSYMDQDDKIFVCKIDMPKWSSGNLTKEVLTWLHNREAK